MAVNRNNFAVKFAECGNCYEAAVFAGAARGIEAAVTGLALLTNSAVRKRISAVRNKMVSCPAEQGLRRIAYGRNNDAFRLAFAETVTDELIEQSDLYGVSEIKVNKNGVEIKFHDRMKALELLNEIEKESRDENSGRSLFEAIYGKGEENIE